MVVGVPFRGASSVPLSFSAAPVARSLRLWMMIALELENRRIQPTRLKQSQCLDLKGGLPLSFSHIPFWDIPIHLWEWMSTSGWSLKKKKKKSRKRVNLSLFGNSRKEEQTREEALGGRKKKGKWRRPCSGPPSTGNSSTHDRDQNWFDLNSSACDNKRGRNPSQWQHQRVWRSQLLLLLPVAPARRKRVALHLPELAQVTLMHQYYYPWRSCMTWRSGKTKNLTIAAPVIMTTTRSPISCPTHLLSLSPPIPPPPPPPPPHKLQFFGISSHSIQHQSLCESTSSLCAIHHLLFPFNSPQVSLQSTISSHSIHHHSLSLTFLQFHFCFVPYFVVQ